MFCRKYIVWNRLVELEYTGDIFMKSKDLDYLWKYVQGDIYYVVSTA